MAVNASLFEIDVQLDLQNRIGGAQIITLPLNLIARIISWIEDPGDLARVCRTCQLLHYMAIPHLYRNISLTSYDRIRYRGEQQQPEGWGNASPFSMGLNTLVTRAHASLVQSMTLRGEWSEPELEELSRVGRVPDSSMMLNIAVRAALDRTRNIESFSWELNTKLMETVYLGLAQLPKLTSLSIRFPTSRHPRPIYVIPAMPHLRSLTVTHIDPLYYPDDISTLLAKSTRLEALKMHWSSRMRENQEPSVVFYDYFRHCIRNKFQLRLKKVSFHNLFSRLTSDLCAIAPDTLEELTFLGTGNNEDVLSKWTFVDKTWSVVRPTAPECSNLKVVRHDLLNREFRDFLNSFKGLEKLYYVSVPANSTTPSHQAMNEGGSNPAGNCPVDSPSTPTNKYPQLRDCHFDTTLANHGTTLRHLLLPSRWSLSSAAMNRLVQVCPNLEQLGLAPEIPAMEALGLLIPSLPKLKALRILVHQPHEPAQVQSQVQINKNSPSSSVDDTAELDDDIVIKKISAITADKNLASKLRIVGLNWKAWALGDFFYIPASESTTTISEVDACQPTENTQPGTITNTNEQKSSTSAYNIGDSSSRVHQEPHPLRSTNGSRPYAKKNIESSLGKRTRDEMSPPPPKASSNGNGSTLVSDSKHVYDTLPSEEKIIWKRHVRPVSWEVIKKWEIWFLDSQDM